MSAALYGGLGPLNGTAHAEMIGMFRLPHQVQVAFDPRLTLDEESLCIGKKSRDACSALRALDSEFA
jgi:hypothetical protein